MGMVAHSTNAPLFCCIWHAQFLFQGESLFTTFSHIFNFLGTCIWIFCSLCVYTSSALWINNLKMRKVLISSFPAYSPLYTFLYHSTEYLALHRISVQVFTFTSEYKLIQTDLVTRILRHYIYSWRTIHSILAIFL